MARVKAAPEVDQSGDEGVATNIKVAMQQHGFSGETCEIKLFKTLSAKMVADEDVSQTPDELPPDDELPTE